jgi:enediyne biosynthesis protein E4
MPASDGPSCIAARPRGRRRWWLAASALAAGLLWGGWAWWRDRSDRDAIARVELEMANGRFGNAGRRLRELLEREPGSEEAAVLLGRCEKERGRVDAADAAFARVAPGSPLAHQAILARMRLAHDRGQFARAEAIIAEAAADPRNDGPYTRFLLVPIYSRLGRLDEAVRLIEGRWEGLRRDGEGASAPAIDAVRMHIELELKPNRVEETRAYLDRASALASDDDRVWLGRANLAIRTGDLDEARRLLDACRARRPEDAAVWDARLRLGLASGRVEDVDEALAHLPAEGWTPARAHRLEAWDAARRGDAAAERRALEALIAADPGDLGARDRLAGLAERAGDSARAAELRRGRDEVRRLFARYLFLYDRVQPLRDAEEMAAIAERLGRTFEARAFLTLAVAEGPDRPDLRRALARLDREREAAVATPGARPRRTSSRPRRRAVRPARRADRPPRRSAARRGPGRGPWRPGGGPGPG